MNACSNRRAVVLLIAQTGLTQGILQPANELLISSQSLDVENIVTCDFFFAAGIWLGSLPVSFVRERRDRRGKSGAAFLGCGKTERKEQHAQDQIQAHGRQISRPPLREIFLRQLARLAQQDVQRLPKSAVNMGRDVPGVLEQRRDGTRALVRVLTALEAIRTHQRGAAIAALRWTVTLSVFLSKHRHHLTRRQPRARRRDRSTRRIRRNSRLPAELTSASIRHQASGAKL